MCGSRTLAECLVLWVCVSLLCDRHRPSSVHPYRVGVPVVGRTVFRLPINQLIPRWCPVRAWLFFTYNLPILAARCVHFQPLLHTPSPTAINSRETPTSTPWNEGGAGARVA